MNKGIQAFRNIILTNAKKLDKRLKPFYEQHLLSTRSVNKQDEWTNRSEVS